MLLCNKTVIFHKAPKTIAKSLQVPQNIRTFEFLKQYRQTKNVKDKIWLPNQLHNLSDKKIRVILYQLRSILWNICWSHIWNQQCFDSIAKSDNPISQNKLLFLVIIRCNLILSIIAYFKYNTIAHFSFNYFHVKKKRKKRFWFPFT